MYTHVQTTRAITCLQLLLKTGATEREFYANSNRTECSIFISSELLPLANWEHWEALCSARLIYSIYESVHCFMTIHIHVCTAVGSCRGYKFKFIVYTLGKQCNEAPTIPPLFFLAVIRPVDGICLLTVAGKRPPRN